MRRLNRPPRFRFGPSGRAAADQRMTANELELAEAVGLDTNGDDDQGGNPDAVG